MFFASRRINFRNYPQSMWFVLFLCVWLLQHNVCARGVSHTQVESRPAPDHGRCQSLVFLGASPPKRMEIRPRSGHERYLIYIKESEVVWFFRLHALDGLKAVFYIFQGLQVVWHLLVFFFVLYPVHYTSPG